LIGDLELEKIEEDRQITPKGIKKKFGRTSFKLTERWKIAKTIAEGLNFINILILKLLLTTAGSLHAG